jgi:excinuclease ABC subunit C
MRPIGHTTRIARMIALTASMVFVSTETETEALLLETNLIKQLKPRFNVLMRDDKSFPYILLTGDHAAAQITKHRGARNRKGAYFGPFASVWAVNRTLNALQRAFLLRSCSDSYFANRTRPCLLYQIKRCSAPCTGEIGEADYAELVREARDFLSGKSRAVRERLADEMTEAADLMEFERPGDQSENRRRGGCFRHRRRRGTVLRRSLFLQDFSELGQSRLFSARRQKPHAGGGPRRLCGAVLRG